MPPPPYLLFAPPAPRNNRQQFQTIDLSGQALTATRDYPVVCRLAAGNPRLARLRLSRAGLCGVTSAGRGRRSLAGVRSLALTLRAAPPRLVVLDVGLNFVDDAAVEILARGFEKNAVLTSLILKGNGMSGKVRGGGNNKNVIGGVDVYEIVLFYM